MIYTFISMIEWTTAHQSVSVTVHWTNKNAPFRY